MQGTFERGGFLRPLPGRQKAKAGRFYLTLANSLGNGVYSSRNEWIEPFSRAASETNSDQSFLGPYTSPSNVKLSDPFFSPRST